ncbi:hypothetical protein ACIRRA_02590 [Nocardia sp. NPDC101769]|uniref:hypothetical protein n=1 Tax=Nocardia sp. NPDC101769 TaxID=3364333 RepID=UPI00380CE8BC
MRFTVALTNSTDGDIPQVAMVVSLGHCTCSSGMASPMPSGTMQMLDTATNTWQSVRYVHEGTGTDYQSQTLVPPFALEHGKTATYQLEMQLDTKQNFAVHEGQSAIHVTIVDAATKKPVTGKPTALPITVEP